jgi:coproporphyrinogen III oxidase-like Fe-S oxidoreductase
VGIQFFQVGDDQQAKEYLQALDDELVRRRSYEGMRDIVDTVPWKGDRGTVLNADGILKCVLGAVNKKYDNRDASH